MDTETTAAGMMKNKLKSMVASSIAAAVDGLPGKQTSEQLYWLRKRRTC